jgi:hypothetical protein
MTTYNATTLNAIAPILEEARKLWAERIAEYVKLHGDVGSCVLGAGITVSYLAKGKRKPVRRLVIYPPTHVQGSCTWEASQKEIVQFLRDRGVDASFAYGNMD